MSSNSYTLNLKTGRIQLHIKKHEYENLAQDQRKEIRKYFIFSKYENAWVSKSSKNHYMAIIIANKLGFTEQVTKEKKIPYEEELKIKAEKAEIKALRYEQYSDAANEKAKSLQSEFNKFRGDIAFLTQPIIKGHAGSQTFSNYRQRILNRYNKGFEEYRKSEYFKEKAILALNSVKMTKLKDRVYLYKRIEECKKIIKRYKEQIENKPNIKEELIKDFEYHVDKLAFLQNCLDEIGGIKYDKNNIKPGYLIRIRKSWAKVERVNIKTVTATFIGESLKNISCMPTYAEINEILIPENWNKNDIQNPFDVNDILIKNSITGTYIISAYQVLKVTEKTVTLQKIEISNNNKPVLNKFINDSIIVKNIRITEDNDYVVYFGNWCHYKYAA